MTRIRRAVAWLRRMPGVTRGYLVLTLVVAFSAFNTINNLLYLVSGLMVALLVVNAVLARANVRKLRMRRRIPKHLYAGTPIDVQIELFNPRKWVGVFGIRIVDAISGQNAHETAVLALAPGERQTTTYRHTFPRRGRHTFEAVTIQSAFPFGLFPRSIALVAPEPVVVYPHIDAVDALMLDAITNPQDFAHISRGDGANIYGMREYTMSDDARHICWKLSAKSASLLMREFEAEQSREVTLVFDNALSGSGNGGLEDFERAVCTTASLASALIDRHFSVRLITRDGRGRIASSQSHLYNILYELALIEPARPDSDGRVPGLSVRGIDPALTVVIVADREAETVKAGHFAMVFAPTNAARAEPVLAGGMN